MRSPRPFRPCNFSPAVAAFRRLERGREVVRDPPAPPSNQLRLFESWRSTQGYEPDWVGPFRRGAQLRPIEADYPDASDEPLWPPRPRSKRTGEKGNLSHLGQPL